MLTSLLSESADVHGHRGLITLQYASIFAAEVSDLMLDSFSRMQISAVCNAGLQVTCALVSFFKCCSRTVGDRFPMASGMHCLAIAANSRCSVSKTRLMEFSASSGNFCKAFRVRFAW